MDQAVTQSQTPGWKDFLKSPHHAWLGVLSLGAGFATGAALPLILGATAYALGWLYLPDTGFFKAWSNRRRDQERLAREQAELEGFLRRRNAILASLSAGNRQRYDALAAVCQSIEDAGPGGRGNDADASHDPRLRKLDELMWTCLRLLSMDQSLQRYLDVETQEDPQRLRQDADGEAKRLQLEFDALPPLAAGDDTGSRDRKQQVLQSRRELLDVLSRRCDRMLQAQDHLALVRSELQRLEQQIKVIRADAMAVSNAEVLSAQIDATVSHLEHTNRWLSEMDEFKDLQTGLPLADVRVGYHGGGTVGSQNEALPPVLDADAASAERRKVRTVREIVTSPSPDPWVRAATDSRAQAEVKAGPKLRPPAVRQSRSGDGPQ